VTRKHFELLAYELKNSRPEDYDSDGFNQLEKTEQWKHDVRAIARACKASNPLFKEERFLLASGLTLEEV
jgi:hypothetical protein